MRINVFEGARRVGLLVGLLWVGGCAIYGFASDTWVQLKYVVPWLHAKPYLSEACGPNDATQYVTKHDRDGHRVHVNLCFKASQSDDGKLLVPYADAPDGKVWMQEPLSMKVTSYTSSVAEAFSLDEPGLKAAAAQQRSARMERAGEALGSAVAGAVLIWIFMLCAGWIVRGFLSIPRGQDSAP